MEDHHHQVHHPHYGIPELRQLMKGGSVGGGGRLTSSSPSSHFPSAAVTAIPSELFGFNLAPHQQHHRLQFGDQEMGFVSRGIHGLSTDSSAAASNAANVNANANATLACTSGSGGGGRGGFGGFLDGGDGGGTGRWPRQETLTLLEIRSRLDHKFKEANQKGPLWDEVSRIMSEEHGYHRSGKKCREKFENLYKYYRKTKEGKAGRQDGKHYRFFRQLEALYGDSNSSVSLPETQFIGNALHFHAPSSNVNTDPSNINNPESVINSLQSLHQKLSIDNSLSLSNNDNSSELDTSSSDDNGNDSTRRKRRGWKAKIKEFIDVQMKRLIERQEVWLERLTKTIEDKEQQRMMREEEWRRLEAARINKEHSFWARERERMEARDVALIEALQCLTGRPLRKVSCSSPEERIKGNENGSDETATNNGCLEGEMGWVESEIAKLMEIRTNMESGFQQVMISGCSDEFLWEEISTKLACLGFDQRSGLMCKEKWEWINNCMRKENKQIHKKRKENSSNCGVYFPRTEEDPMYNSHGNGYNNNQSNDHNHHGHGSSSPSNSNQANTMANNVCFPFLMGDGDQNIWESYGLRLSKGENQ